ncbi:MAG: T9SS type A sorting domain-containing protein [Bacteroidales bacterium]|nr:T9SS type A sorting domain-containing protein [Bacteroidales bacterium]
MKKLFTIAIIAISMQATAQFNHSIYAKQQSPKSALKSVNFGITDEDLQSIRIEKIDDKNAIQLLNMTELPVMQVNDSTYYWKWDITNSAWIVNSKSINNYNSNNDLLSGMTQNWNGNAWENYFLESQSFDANNNRISFSFQFWNNNSWDNANVYSFTYDANNRLAETLEKSWDGNVWVNFNLFSCMYNGNFKLASVLDKTWNGSSWENSKITSYTYDATDNLISLLIQNWNGNSWVNSDLNTFTYDPNNNLTSDLYQKDLYGGSTWENMVLVSYTFDVNNNRTSKLSQSWKNNAWSNNYLESNSYNINNKLTSTLSKYYNNNAWENSGQELFTYDTITNQTRSIAYNWQFNAWVMFRQSLLTYNSNNPLNFYSSMSKNWDVTGTKVNNGDSICYYYHTPTTGIANLKENGIAIYPNPSKGKVTINKENTPAYIEIYNSIGTRIYSDLEFNRQTAIEIDLSGYPKGIYFVKINNQKNSITKKVIIQ